MANEWNTSYPIDHTKIGNLPTELRKLKTSTKTQIGLEHEDPVDGDATGSEHSSGSAVAFEGTDTPTTRPGGAALGDNAIDRGRLWLDDNSDPPVLKRWTGAAFTEAIKALGGITPATYAGEESVTFANGLTIKFGEESVAAYATDEVTYEDAFDNGVIAAFATYKTTENSYLATANATAKSGSETTILQVTNGVNATVTIAWCAIGD